MLERQVELQKTAAATANASQVELQKTVAATANTSEIRNEVETADGFSFLGGIY